MNAQKILSRAKQWPKIHTHKLPSGQLVYRVDLRVVKKGRPYFDTLQQAETAAEQYRIQRTAEGQAAFNLAMDVRLDAAKADAILKPHGVSILDAAKYYDKHVLAYTKAPLISEIVVKYIADCKHRNLRDATVKDVTSRLTAFSEDFGSERLSDVTLDELKEWVQDDTLAMRSRINYLTKLSQLYGFALRNKWVDSNITESIERPKVDETTPEIFTVEQAEKLLTLSHDFKLLPYIAIGLFAGVRSAEMMRLDAKALNFEANSLTIGASIAKKRSQRIIDMQPALVAWLEPVKAELQKGGPIVNTTCFWRNKAKLLEAAEFADVAKRVPERIQITTDAFLPYPAAIRRHLLGRLDYAVMVKQFAATPGQVEAKRRYSPAPFVGVRVKVKAGNPRRERICTSHVERANLTVRHFNKRFARLSLGYSKTLDNHRYAIALFVCAYNFCKVHSTLGCTPAVGLKLATETWTIERLIEEATK